MFVLLSRIVYVVIIFDILRCFVRSVFFYCKSFCYNCCFVFYIEWFFVMVRKYIYIVYIGGIIGMKKLDYGYVFVVGFMEK